MGGRSPSTRLSCTHINLDSIITYLFEARAPLWITLLVTIKCKFYFIQLIVLQFKLKINSFKIH